MLIFCQRLHISGSVKWPLSYKHNLLDMELFPWEYPITLFETISNRIVCVLMELSDVSILLISIYMPCDSNHLVDVEYDEILCEIQTLHIKHTCTYRL